MSIGHICGDSGIQNRAQKHAALSIETRGADCLETRAHVDSPEKQNNHHPYIKRNGS